MGVPPSLFGSNQTGNLVFSSTIPPAPSSTFFLRSSTRSVCSLIAWIGCTMSPDKAPPNPLLTCDPA